MINVLLFEFIAVVVCIAAFGILALGAYWQCSARIYNGDLDLSRRKKKR